jgi:hypothetical protein
MVADDARIGELGEQLARLQRRATRQKREISRKPDAWQRWSDTMSEIVTLIDHLVTIPASNVGSLEIKFRAILWLIETDESVLDSGDLRRLRRFGRDLSTSHRRE